jgi:catechol 2,3-dioxygenase-like lactoylglutathione lyase family enzyme
VSARIQRPDHVELLVPNRAEAAAWYGRVLGLVPVESAARWAENADGPMMLSSDGTAGQVMLALFAGDPQGHYPERGFRRLAFRTSADGFLAFVSDVEHIGVTDGGAAPPVVDHGEAFSVYFQDPYGTHLEVTPYEHERVRRMRLPR